MEYEHMLKINDFKVTWRDSPNQSIRIDGYSFVYRGLVLVAHKLPHPPHRWTVSEYVSGQNAIQVDRYHRTRKQAVARAIQGLSQLDAKEIDRLMQYINGHKIN